MDALPDAAMDSTSGDASDAGTDSAPPDAGMVTPSPDRPFSDDIVYFVMTDRFANGDWTNDQGSASGVAWGGFDPTSKSAFHGGDLAGLTAKLGYIQSLGATAIWLTPVVTNRAVQQTSSIAYHGYFGVDFLAVDPHLGKNKDFAELVEQAHKLGLKVFLDIVVNHTADVIHYRECSLCAYRDSSQTPYTPAVDSNLAMIKNPAWLNDPVYYHNRGDSTFSGESSLQGDFFGLDDLDTSSQVVIDGMIAIYRHWIETYGVDGFRIDTFKHVDSELWRQFLPAMQAAAAARGIPHFTMFGEIFEGQTAGLAGYTRAAGLESALDFPLEGSVRAVFGRSSPTDILRNLFAEDDLYTGPRSDARSMANFISSHDEGRFGLSLDRAMPESEKMARSKLAQAFMMFARGVPVIYYGDEQGFIGDGGDSEARQDMMRSRVASYNDDDLIGTSKTTADDNFDVSHPLFQAIAGHAAVYKAHEALRRGVQLFRYSSDSAGLAAFSRILPDDRIEYLVAFNNATSAARALVTTSSPSTIFQAVHPAGGASLTSDASGALDVTVPALAFAIYRADKPIPVPGGPLSIAITSPQPDAVLRNLVEITSDVTAGPLASVSFEISLAGGAFEPLGTDWTPPYRVLWDPSRITQQTEVDLRATVDDLRGTRQSAVVHVRVDPRVPGQLVIHYENGNSRTQAALVSDDGEFRGLAALAAGTVSLPVKPGDSSFLVLFESRTGDSFAFDQPLHFTTADLASYLAPGPGGSLVYEIYVNNNLAVAGTSNFVGSGAPPALPVNPTAPAPFGATALLARGSMNSWGTGDAMTYVGNYTYKATIALAGGAIEHKFADASWTDATNFGGPYGARGASAGGGTSNLHFTPSAPGNHEFYFFAIPAGAGQTYLFHHVVPQ